MLRFDHLSLRRGPRELFSEATLLIHPGQRVGVTGANGCGKSSLFALILNQIHADHGEFKMPRNWVSAHVAQETPSGEGSALDFVLDGDSELREIEQALHQAEVADRGEQIATLHTRLDNIGGYSAPSRAAQLIHGLGFGPSEEHRPVNSFSGGWRMRLNLARALMCRSDLLLLDEPTNHLDLDAVIWLEGWLRGYPGTLLLISHDRDFLDAVTDHIAHIEQGRLTIYSGNYSAFERIRAERLANQQALHEKQQREIAHMQSFVARFRAKATKARQAQSRLKALERIERIAPAHVDSPFQFHFFAPEKIPHPLLRILEGSCGYGEKAILNQLSLTLNPGDRIGLLGPNGAGKSTLIKLLADELALQAGERIRAQDLNIGYFAQHQLDQLHPGHTPIEHLVQLDKGASEQSLRNYLGSFGFSGEKADSPVQPFSGGEKARLVLALLIYQRPNLLLLDEPTNHLDLEMRHALSLALQEFEGAMVVVSHDRHLLRSCTDTLLLVNQGRIEEFKGDLDDYPRWLIDNRNNAPSELASAGTAPQPESSINRREQKRLDAQRRQQMQPLRKALQQAEQQVEALTHRQQQLEQALADPEIYDAANKTQLKELLEKKGQCDAQLEAAETAWMAAEEALEAAKAS